MRAPLPGTLTLTQLFGSLRGGPGEAYSVVHGKTTYQNYAHNGIDFNAPIGTPVLAMKGGILTFPPKDPWWGGYAYGLGTYAVITLPSGETHIFGHLSEILLPQDAVVLAGKGFARSGNSGNSTGPHLHVGVRPALPDYGNGLDGCIDFLDHFDHGVLASFDFSLV